MEKFKIPTEDEVKQYALELSYRINPSAFIAYYESKGWKVGSSPMKSWKAAVKTWKIKAQENGSGVFAAVPKESEEDRRRRLLSAKKCLYCKPPGDLEKYDDGRIICRSCNSDLTRFYK